jgi:DNA-binding winged helix-turn-helix (wHTH) protein/tetratricopeptide (TPR) repeat protein
MTVASQSDVLLQFGPYALDVQSGELRKGGVRLHLRGKPIHILRMLLQCAGAVVTREEMIASLWNSTTFVEFEQNLNVNVRRLRDALCEVADQPRWIETVPGAGYRFIGSVTRTEATNRARTTKSGRVAILVLPIENQTGNEQSNYLAAGLTEELARELSQVAPGQMRVVGRESARSATHGTVKSLASAVHAQHIVAGVLDTSLDGMCLDLYLSGAGNTRCEWSNSFNVDSEDARNMLRASALEIANCLRLEVAPQNVRIGAPGTISAVRHSYLRGRYSWHRRSSQDLWRAIAYYKHAVSLDSDYGPAWAGLAQAYNVLAHRCSAPPREVGPLAGRAANRAIALVPELAEACAALGWHRFAYCWKPKEAETAFHAGLAADPEDPILQHAFGMYLLCAGRLHDAIAHFRVSLELDPFFPGANSALTWAYMCARLYGDAIDHGEQVRSHEPKYPANLGWLAVTHALMGNVEASIECGLAVAEYSMRDPLMLCTLAYAYARAGMRERALAVIAEVTAPEASYIPSGMVARAWAGLGEAEKCVSWLQRGYDERSEWVLWAGLDPMMDNMAADEKFGGFVARLWPSRRAGI